MKVAYAPLVSSASGRFGGMVFSRWRGITLIRSFTMPAQPRTSRQVLVRNFFRGVTSMFLRGSAVLGFRHAWTQAASGMAELGRNRAIGELVGYAGAPTTPATWALAPMLPAGNIIPNTPNLSLIHISEPTRPY